VRRVQSALKAAAMKVCLFPGAAWTVADTRDGSYETKYGNKVIRVVIHKDQSTYPGEGFDSIADIASLKPAETRSLNG